MAFFGGRKQQQKSAPTSAPSATEKKTVPPPSAAPVPSRQPVGFETVLGVNATLHGDLRSQANVRLDGVFEGTLEIDGNVLVGETAKIIADIHAKNISVAGAVRGNISGKKIQLLRTARVWGNISASAITTEEGAFIDGKLTMVQHDASITGMEMPSSLLDEPEDRSPAPDDELEIIEGEPVPASESENKKSD